MERYVSVTGWSKKHNQIAKNKNLTQMLSTDNNETGYIVYDVEANGTTMKYLKIAEDKITLKRCAEILADAEALTGNTYSKIEIEDTIFDEETKITIYKKKYIYNKSKNRLTIWEMKRGEKDLKPVYQNWDGYICKDSSALADCLM